MSNDRWVPVKLLITNNTMIAVEKAAEEYGMSKSKMFVALIEAALKNLGAPIETSYITPDGVKNQKGVSVFIRNPIRELL